MTKMGPIEFVKLFGLFYLVSLITLPFILITFAIFFIYKQIVFLILRLFHNASDIIMLNSSDVFWTYGENLHNVVDIVMVLNLKFGNANDFLKVVKRSLEEKILKHPEKFPKMTSTLESFLGYSYLLKTNISIDDCVRAVKVDTEKSLSETVHKSAVGNKLPLDDKFLWEIVIFNSDNKWNKKNSLKENQVLLLLRINHTLGDGLSLINIAAKDLAENNVDFNQKIDETIKKHVVKKNIAIKILEKVNLFLITPGYLIINMLGRRPDAWDSPLVSHKKRIFWRAETDEKLVKMIKTMKSKIGDTGFTDILLTAISASLDSFLKQKQTPEAPEHGLMLIIIIGAVLAHLDRSDGTPDLKNQFSCLLLNLPLCLKSGSNLQRLELLKKETKKFTKSPALWANHLVLNTVGFLMPEPLVKLIVKIHKFSLAISNLPGLPKITLWSAELANIYFFPPHRDQMGFNFGIVTYDDKLQFGVAADKTTAPSDDDCQKLVDNFFENLTALNKEVFIKNE